MQVEVKGQVQSNIVVYPTYKFAADTISHES